MTKQTINLIGGVVVGAIVVLGLLFGVLPRLSAARTADTDRDSAAMQNRNQQMLNAGLAAQMATLPTLQAEVAALKQEIPSGPHLEQLIKVVGGLPAGATLRSITPGTGVGTAASSAPAPQATGAGDFISVPVTMVFDVRQLADSAAVLDTLRAGPRLFAVDTVGVAASGDAGKKAGYTLTVTGRAFAADAATASASAQPTAQATTGAAQ
jgi:hypothetical protein